MQEEQHSIEAPEFNEDSGEWEVKQGEYTYSFTEETQALQFYNLQQVFIQELDDGYETP